uniref:Uncharacterized protein n=1 Tax=Arundo donax TaxID=35708 RepID=A0A0A9G8P5_ARUDO
MCTLKLSITIRGTLNATLVVLFNRKDAFQVPTCMQLDYWIIPFMINLKEEDGNPMHMHIVYITLHLMCKPAN